MSETVEIEIAEPYHGMLEKLRQRAESNPDADLRQMVEDAIHNGYQQSQSER